MSAIAKAGIPGIPLAALDAITDVNVRTVLRAIVDGWHVRNGASGSGENRFITAGELGATSGARLVGGLAGAVQQIPPRVTGITPGEISRVIADLQAAVIESPLFKELGERITLINAGQGVGMNEERIQRLNDDNALVQAINTIWATIGEASGLVQRGEEGIANTAGATAQAWQQVQSTIKDPVTGAYIASAAVRTNAETAVNKAGQLEGKYTVKVDVNGHVSGFGLASTANNATPFSEFIARVDRFAIGSPSMPDFEGYVDAYSDLRAAWMAAGSPDKATWGADHYYAQGQGEGRVAPNKIPVEVPFIVTTTRQTVNGRTVDPGVYMARAFISNGMIGRAQIGVAEVDTLILEGNAVTQPVTYANTGYQYYPPVGSWSSPVGTIAVDLGPGVAGALIGAMVMFTFEHDQISGGIQQVNFRVKRDGLVVLTGYTNHPNNSPPSTVTSFAFDAAGAGIHTYTLEVMEADNVLTPSRIRNLRMFVLGTKR